eukprot:4231330-Pyramimonas_sp.AAC.1
MRSIRLVPRWLPREGRHRRPDTTSSVCPDVNEHPRGSPPPQSLSHRAEGCGSPGLRRNNI